MFRPFRARSEHPALLNNNPVLKNILINRLVPRGKVRLVPAPPAVETRQDSCYNLYKDQAVIRRIRIAKCWHGSAATEKTEGSANYFM
jgi:hypothetical protein